MEQVEIVSLRPVEWEEYKNLRLQALPEEPQVFLSTYKRSSEDPDNKWKERLEAFCKGKVSVIDIVDKSHE